MASVTVRNLRKSFDGSHEVIRGVDLDVADGEFMVFVGPSGCGKTTMLRMIAGLETISAGELLIDGQPAHDLPPVERGMAMVFQSYALYPHMTVAENMGFSLKMARAPKREIRMAVERAAEILRITHLLDAKPKELSGGQRQRVAIGRAIVRKPRVFLFDEPLSNLDAGLRVQMRIELSKLHRELGSTMIYVTHDQVEAMTMGDRIAVFHQGLLEQVGRPMELYQDPENTFIAEFLGSPKMNLLPAFPNSKAGKPTLRVGEDVLPLKLPVAWPGGIVPEEILLGVRPEHIEVAPTPDGRPAIRGTLDAVERLGDTVLLHVRVPSCEQPVAVKLPERGQTWDLGAAVALHPREESWLLFAKDGARLL